MQIHYLTHQTIVLSSRSRQLMLLCVGLCALRLSCRNLMQITFQPSSNVIQIRFPKMEKWKKKILSCLVFLKSVLMNLVMTKMDLGWQFDSVQFANKTFQVMDVF